MTFGVNMVAIAEGKPQQMGLKKLIAYYIAHQEDVVTRRTQFDLDAAERREHILEGLMVAILNIDEVIALIRASKTPKEARDGLMQRFALSEIQAQAILDLRLQRLTNLELLAIEKEYKDVKKKIQELKAILNSKDKLRAVIKAELTEIRDQYSTPRRTRLIHAEKRMLYPNLKPKFRRMRLFCCWMARASAVAPNGCSLLKASACLQRLTAEQTGASNCSQTLVRVLRSLWMKSQNPNRADGRRT